MKNPLFNKIVANLIITTSSLIIFAPINYAQTVSISNQENSQKLITEYTQTISSNPQDGAAYYNRGNIYAELKNYEQAIIDYDRAIYIYLNYGSSSTVIEESSANNQIISFNPDLEKAYFVRANSYYNLQNFNKAIADYTAAIRLNISNYKAYYNRGLAYSNIQQAEQAIADYSQALKLNPTNPQAYYHRGVSYLSLNQRENAIADWQQAANLFKENNQLNDYQKTLSQLEKLQN